MVIQVSYQGESSFIVRLGHVVELLCGVATGEGDSLVGGEEAGCGQLHLFVRLGALVYGLKLNTCDTATSVF